MLNDLLHSLLTAIKQRPDIASIDCDQAIRYALLPELPPCKHVRCEIQMPFYLVTHTALVEAEDETGAAEKVMADLQTEARMTFTVKLDEHSIKHVSVNRRQSVVDDKSIAQPVVEENSVIRRDPAGSRPMRDDRPADDGLGKQKPSFGTIGVTFSALCVAACVLAGLLYFTL